MSSIPKISVSMPTRRSKSDLSFDCNTSANFGELQPSMARIMVPNQTNRVKVNSIVRLASMPLPTFANIHLRHYHAFVPFSQLWEQMSSFLSQQVYSQGAISFVPQQIPRFYIRRFWAQFIRQYSYISVVKKDDVNTPLPLGHAVTDEGQKFLQTLRQLMSTTTNFAAFGQNVDDIGGKFVFPHFQTSESIPKGGFVFADNLRLTVDPYNLPSGVISGPANTAPLNIDVNEDSQAALGAVGVNGADFSEQLAFWRDGKLVYTDYVLCYKLMPFAKHLRKIVIGLGSQFNPYHIQDEPEHIFKLLAFYKVWFEYFRPKREISWPQTHAWQLIKLLNDTTPQDFQWNGQLNDDLELFLLDLMRDTFYYFPQDYFGMSTVTPTQGNSISDTSISTPYTGSVNGEDDVQVNHFSQNGQVDDDHASSPLGIKLAQKLLTFVNKNTVIGRSIREYIRVHYGVFEDAAPDSSGVTRIGVSDLQVQVAEVTSTAPSPDGFLGEYAGIGVGKDSSETFDYTAKEFGVWITMSCVFPMSGYYQGTLPENKYKDRFEFFTPEFDALGYQVLSRSELHDNFIANSENFDPNNDYKPLDGFGFVPRYSEYKVGRNIVNGDLSLGGMSSLRPYFLDRRLPEVAVKSTYDQSDSLHIATSLDKPSFIPSVVFDDFRKLDPSDVLGQFNRLFNVTTNWFDHFIIQSSFVVSVYAPWKSLNDSFDTFNEGEDTINVIKS